MEGQLTPPGRRHPDAPDSPDLPALLDATVLNGCVRHDATFGQELPAAAAAGLEPLFVQPQHIGVRCAGGSLADFRQDVDEADEFFGELGEDRRERVRLVSAQGVVRTAADADVVVHVHQRAIQRIGKESGDEEGTVADLFQAGTLLRTAALEGIRKTYGQWRIGLPVLGRAVIDEARKELDHVKRGHLVGGEALMCQSAIDELLEKLDSRFPSKHRITHRMRPVSTTTADAIARCVPIICRAFSRDYTIVRTERNARFNEMSALR